MTTRRGLFAAIGAMFSWVTAWGKPKYRIPFSSYVGGKFSISPDGPGKNWFKDGPPGFLETAKYAESVMSPEVFKVVLKKNQDSYCKYLVKEGDDLWRKDKCQEITEFHRQAAIWLAADTLWANQ